MALVVCKDENEWVNTTQEWLLRQLHRNGERTDLHSAKRLFVPAGETPRPLYSRWRQNHPNFLKQVQFVQLDEVLDGNLPFQKFFCEELPDYQPQFEFISTAERGGDIALLGLGVNGHVAFHEPGLPREFYSGCLRLSGDSCQRLSLPPSTRAVSYGVGAFLRARAIAILVRGRSKREILKRVLARDTECPASWLLDHPNLVVITDAEAVA